MSQRTENVNEYINVDLKLKVIIKQFSNHNGFSNGQIDRAIHEFKEKIQKHLINMITEDYQMSEMLYSTDFVDFEVLEAE